MLTVKNLEVFTKSNNQILEDISFNIDDTKTLCILGQSGSGKSVLAYSIMDILHTNLLTKNGEIILFDKVLTSLSSFERRKILGKDISLIMQNPLTALDPTVKIGKQIMESLRIHNKNEKKEALIKKTYELLKDVSLDKQVFNNYPHEVSGGMAQKAVIAIAIANNPKLIIADEPITALDHKSTSDILNLLKEKQKEYNSMMIYISHDIASVEFMADNILVLYKGSIMEIMTKEEFKTPLHPYTIELKNSVITGTYNEKKIEISKKTANETLGCKYYNYCKLRTDDCKKNIELKKINNRFVRCINIKE